MSSMNHLCSNQLRELSFKWANRFMKPPPLPGHAFLFVKCTAQKWVQNEYVFILKNRPNFSYIFFVFCYHFYHDKYRMQSNPFQRVPKVVTTKDLSGILSQHSMLILDNLVWILRHKSCTRPRSFLQIWWLGHGLLNLHFSSVGEFMENYRLHPNIKCLRFLTQCHTKIHLG